PARAPGEVDGTIIVAEERGVDPLRERAAGAVRGRVGAFRLAGGGPEDAGAQARDAVGDVIVVLEVVDLRGPDGAAVEFLAIAADLLRPLLLPGTVAVDAPDEAKGFPRLQVRRPP